MAVAADESTRVVSEPWRASMLFGGAVFAATPVLLIGLHLGGSRGDDGERVPLSLVLFLSAVVGPLAIVALTVHRARIDFPARRLTIWRFYPIPWKQVVEVPSALDLVIRKSACPGPYCYQLDGKVPGAAGFTIVMNVTDAAAREAASLLVERLGAMLDPEVDVIQYDPP